MRTRDVTQQWQFDQRQYSFVSIAAHKLRTPLSAVMGFSELLQTRNPEEATDRAERFTTLYRVRTAKTEGIRGTGPGLYISKQVVELMGGRMWVNSDAGQGSTFSFSVPLAPVPTEPIVIPVT